MKKNLTDITIVLDRSGSMTKVADDTVGGFNEFVKEQSKVKGKAVLTLVQFDNEYEVVYEAKPIKEIGGLEFHPRSMTALLDAIGRTIHSTQKRLDEIKEKDRPGKVIFVILTDGYENASREFKKDQINKLINEREGKWQFVFLGANQDAIKEAGDIGISLGSAMTYTQNTKGMASAFYCTSANITSLRNSTDTTTDTFYDNKDREEQIKALKDN